MSTLPCRCHSSCDCGRLAREARKLAQQAAPFPPSSTPVWNDLQSTGPTTGTSYALQKKKKFGFKNDSKHMYEALRWTDGWNEEVSEYAAGGGGVGRGGNGQTHGQRHRHEHRHEEEECRCCQGMREELRRQMQRDLRTIQNNNTASALSSSSSSSSSSASSSYHPQSHHDSSRSRIHDCNSNECDCECHSHSQSHSHSHSQSHQHHSQQHQSHSNSHKMSPEEEYEEFLKWKTEREQAQQQYPQHQQQQEQKVSFSSSIPLSPSSTAATAGSASASDAASTSSSSSNPSHPSSSSSSSSKTTSKKKKKKKKDVPLRLYDVFQSENNPSSLTFEKRLSSRPLSASVGSSSSSSHPSSADGSGRPVVADERFYSSSLAKQIERRLKIQAFQRRFEQRRVQMALEEDPTLTDRRVGTSVISAVTHKPPFHDFGCGNTHPVNDQQYLFSHNVSPALAKGLGSGGGKGGDEDDEVDERRRRGEEEGGGLAGKSGVYKRAILVWKQKEQENEQALERLKEQQKNYHSAVPFNLLERPKTAPIGGRGDGAGGGREKEREKEKEGGGRGRRIEESKEESRREKEGFVQLVDPRFAAPAPSSSSSSSLSHSVGSRPSDPYRNSSLGVNGQFVSSSPSPLPSHHHHQQQQHQYRPSASSTSSSPSVPVSGYVNESDWNSNQISSRQGRRADGSKVYVSEPPFATSYNTGMERTTEHHQQQHQPMRVTTAW